MTKLESFISEHTAEFLLVPQMQATLQKSFWSVIPLFVWVTREGSNFARREMAGRKFRVCALFPRRPKIDRDGKIFLKLNEQVLFAAENLHLIGIPVFAGIPILSHLTDLNVDCECNWYQLLPGGAGDVTIPITSEVDEPYSDFLNQIFINELSTNILRDAIIFEYGEAIEHIRFVKTNFSMGMYTSVYKPIFFFMEIHA